MTRPSPALVTPQAVRRLPRWVPWLLIAAYVLPGFVGRDPWRGAELTTFAVMLDMRDGGPWLRPQVLGEPVTPLQWLPYWLGAAAMKVLPLPAAWAAQLPFMALLLLTLACTWYTTYRLARQPAALPLVPAFGEAVRPADYARALADGALLALVATLGLAMLAHELGAAAVRLAAVALLGWAGAHAWPLAAHGAGPVAPWRGVAAAWVALLMLALAGLPWLALVLGAALLAWWWRAGVARPAWAAALLGAVLAPALTWALAEPAGGWAALDWPRGFAWTRAEEWRSLGRLLAWFVWPAALLALWALWRWRRHWAQPHVGWPLTLATIVLAASVADGGGNDRLLLLALPALATLAAWALPTLRGSLAAAVDWFALLFYTGAAVIVWVIWVAMMTGVPPKPAANVARLVPGFEPPFEPLPVAAALLASAAWVGLVVWRVGRHAPALWKGLVLSASGLTLNWLLLMTLWLPLLNWGMGLRPISERIAARVPAGTCVAVSGLGPGELGALRHHAGLTLERLSSPAARACPLLLTGPRVQPGDVPDGWRLHADFVRLRGERERWRLWERAPAD